MDISPSQLITECDRFLAEYGSLSWAAEMRHGLPRGLLLAVGSRETNLTDEVGDGGHGHGVWQLDDRSHAIPNPFPVALQADMAAAMLSDELMRTGGNVDQAANLYNSGQRSDAGTTGHDYGTDVAGRLATIQAHYKEGDDMDPDTIVRLAYRLCLLREPDAGGYATQIAFVQGGGTFGQLLQRLTDSPEGQNVLDHQRKAIGL